MNAIEVKADQELWNQLTDQIKDLEAREMSPQRNQAIGALRLAVMWIEKDLHRLTAPAAINPDSLMVK